MDIPPATGCKARVAGDAPSLPPGDEFELSYLDYQIARAGTPELMEVARSRDHQMHKQAIDETRSSIATALQPARDHPDAAAVDRLVNFLQREARRPGKGKRSI